MFCKHEDVQNGIDQESQARTRKETADSHIEGHKKRIIVGLSTSAQAFALGPNILAAKLEQKRISVIFISTKETTWDRFPVPQSPTESHQWDQTEKVMSTLRSMTDNTNNKFFQMETPHSVCPKVLWLSGPAEFCRHQR